GSVYEDFMLISMIKDIFDDLKINFSLKINSLGCHECMPPYRTKLVSFLEEIKDDLCEDCNRRIVTNPIRVLDCKNEKCQTLLQTSPKLIDNLCKNCDDDFTKLQTLLNETGISYEVDTNLVRGLDYYSKTAFEFISNDIGSQSAIAGGGRYDRLVEFLDGKPTPAVGFALGIERIMDLVQLPEPKRKGLYLGGMNEEAIHLILKIAKEQLKTQKVTMEYKSKSLKAHLKSADRAGARMIGIIGEDELLNGTIWMKDLETKEEKTVQLSEL
ncbi:MAG: histidine--tRNA ligase, partial [Campylobacterales bacterium]|nr:histidine--tRNA ligase [Campylobacterales bacterium]